MKFCLNNRVSSQYLKKADQIKIAYRDIKSLPVLSDNYPDKELVICMPKTPLEEKELSMLLRYNKLHSGGLILAFTHFPSFEAHTGFRFYASYPVESFSEAKALIDAGSEAIKVGGPLFFHQEKLKMLNAQIRLTPNQSWLSVVPRENGIQGQWIRPEDLHLYDALPNPIVEFDFCAPEEEEALYRIYAEEHAWPGPLSMIVQNLGHPVANRVLPKNLGKARLNCGHKCQEPDRFCSVCPTAFNFAHSLKRKIDKP